MPPRARRGEGIREPERPLMAAISDALGIEHHDCGRGSNVEGSFLVAVADALGLDRQAGGTIEDNIDLLVGALTGLRGARFYSPGGTITNEVLAVILRGILDRGLAVIPMDYGAPAARVALALAAQEGGPDAEEEVLEALDLSDERTRSLRNVVVREGQGLFRAHLLRAYSGRCAITGTAVEQVLEAAHIRPYRGPNTNRTSNGLLLRADLHRMWDVGLLAVDEHDLSVLLADQVTDPTYTQLRGRQIRLPEDPAQQPSPEALRLQREWAFL